MNIKPLGLLTVFFAMLGSFLVYETPKLYPCYAQSLAQGEKCNSDCVKIEWGNVKPLNFTGKPGEVQTGEVAFQVNSNFKCQMIEVRLVGTPFTCKESTIYNTQYQSDGDSIWHSAGEPFVVKTILGKKRVIRFRVTTGGRIASQCAGEYSAKITAFVLSVHDD